MIVTTTQTVEGRQIAEYKGIVFGEVVSGVNFVKDLFSGITDIFGGRSSTYENELQEAREKAIDEMNSPHLLGFGATPQGLSSMQWHVTLL
jgi:uncharacterized protein YbjQ (UPF0145 family)